MMEEVMHSIRNGLNRFPFLQSLVRESTIKGWEKLLCAHGDPRHFIGKMKFNLLVTLFLAGGPSEHPFFLSATTILKKLEAFMEAFPELAQHKKFRIKINNLGGVNFLSTLSELSIAYPLHRAGYFIEFEKPFQRNASKSLNDVDVTAWIPGRQPFHIEVYMPNEQIETLEEIDFTVIGLKEVNFSGTFLDFAASNDDFSRKVDIKNITKFGVEGFKGLEGMSLLGVNLVYVDMVFLQVKTGIADFSKLQEVLENSKGVQAMILFTEDFGSQSSFELQQILYKRAVN